MAKILIVDDEPRIRELIREYDFIIDGTDNFPAKFLINDACVLEKKPFSHAGIIRFKGQLMTYVPGQGPCYRCHRIFTGDGSDQVSDRCRRSFNRFSVDV